jgi:dTDP-4-dehydrorhamnose 3,5-epimerase
MNHQKSKEISDIKIIDINRHKYSRGHLYESFRKKSFLKKIDFCQDNIVKSNYACLRGLHYQQEPYAQSKLITIIEGEIQDVVVDIRLSSKTFGKYFSIVLSENDSRQLFIPKGFAHGFLTLTKYSIVHYKVDNFYKPDKQFGIAYNDNILGINWKINQKNIIISDKDKRNPFFKDAKYFD